MKLPNFFAFLSPVHSLTDTVGANRRFPTGGSAKGTPKKAKTGLEMPLAKTFKPRREVLGVKCAIGSISVLDLQIEKKKNYF